MKSLQQMLADIVESEGDLTPWERDFISNCQGAVDRHGTTKCLSEARAEKIDQIWRRLHESA